MGLERKLFVEAIAAEIAHDIMSPVSYFKTLLQRSARGEIVDRDDLDLALSEITRLEALVGRLKKLAAHRLHRAPIGLAELVASFREPAFGQLEIDVAATVRLVCDASRLRVALQALVENALEASGAQGTAGIRWSSGPERAALCVWDSGPGFESAPAFAVSSASDRAGLGLLVAQRTIRSHGWQLEFARRDGTTCATIYVRPEDVQK